MFRKAFLSFVVFAWMADVHAGAALSRIPDVIENERAGAVPVWVSAERAVEAEGNLRSDVIEPARVAELRRRLMEREKKPQGSKIDAEAEDPCDTTTSYIPEQFSATASTSDLVGNSQYIFSASVAAVGQGFYFGTPGSLLALDVKQRLKYEKRDALEQPVYIFFPQATIETAQGTICARPWPRMSMPAVGDQILIFAYSRPFGLNAGVFELRPDKQLLFEGRDGAYVPEALRHNDGRASSFSAIVETIRRHPKISEHPAAAQVW